VDEPALREGLPLKRARWESYLSWAVRAFRLSTVVAAPATQIVTHLCYSEFADILPVRIFDPHSSSPLLLMGRFACAKKHAPLGCYCPLLSMMHLGLGADGLSSCSSAYVCDGWSDI
jgi:hypothetical protein